MGKEEEEVKIVRRCGKKNKESNLKRIWYFFWFVLGVFFCFFFLFLRLADLGYTLGHGHVGEGLLRHAQLVHQRLVHAHRGQVTGGGAWEVRHECLREHGSEV